MRGRGEFKKIATALDIHTTLVSQVFNGKKCLTEEQAFKLCLHMGLNTLETNYFMKLVQIERAGSRQLKSLYESHLKEIQEQAGEVKRRVPEPKKLTEKDRALFYSSWQYSLIRLMTSIERFQTVSEIASYLGLSISRVQEILEFLVSCGLCTEENGRFKRTVRNTHIEAQSALALRHHQNWRTKALSLQERITTTDLCFTAPISISKNDLPKIRSLLLEVIADIAKIVDDSPAEELVYLGIDWIKM